MVKKVDDEEKRRTFIKGIWTAEEDKKLKDYMTLHPKGKTKWKWTSLPALAGLNRCAKSCRLRWLNYLKPGLKKGDITEEEEDIIMRIHNLIGNR
ncbi:hypothetical protein IFM89_016576 [Coptis chinensis]|uniref:Uncharacterized protein n=1 Tax=Coptis chinensis TaxID=261450 RepID=A0A835LVX3_9MAGN|nr:hypothetical protein IFM89_016576 [Coptis chinensis]